jgi:serine/threonine-protein kinase
MRWNPFRRTDSVEAAPSSFESTVVDESVARTAGTVAAEAAAGDAVARPALPPSAPSAASAAAIVESETIGHVGRYALKTVLGKGGLGTVYAAWDPLLSRTVALKTLHIDADPSTRESFDALFLNEARAAAGLSHPHIVTVFDAGPSDAGVYIAMERLQGQDLRHLLMQGVRPGPIEAAQVVRRIADALAYAHRKGVVHCDIKPANIFMTGRMHPKVLDFGIARVAHRDVPALEGLAAGSPFYLAPEQIEGRSVDRRSDVYSLGVVLYELLAGKRPFEGRSLDEITSAVRAGDATPAHRVSPKVPLGLSLIAGRAMARDPDQRYPSARHLSMELRHWLDSSEAAALRSESRGGGGASSARAPSNGLRIARVAVPVGLLCAVGGIWWTRAMLGDERAAVPAAPAASAAQPAAGPAPASAVVAAAAPAAVPASVPAPAASAAAPVAAAEAGASTPEAAPAPAPAPSSEATPAPARPAATADRALTKAEIARRRKAMAVQASTGATPAPLALATEGIVQLAVSPWGQIEVDGRAMGTSPPLTRLTLSTGPHTITVRNTDFPPYTVTLTVSGEDPVTLRHRFGP